MKPVFEHGQEAPLDHPGKTEGRQRKRLEDEGQPQPVPDAQHRLRQQRGLEREHADRAENDEAKHAVATVAQILAVALAQRVFGIDPGEDAKHDIGEDEEHRPRREVMDGIEQAWCLRPGKTVPEIEGRRASDRAARNREILRPLCPRDECARHREPVEGAARAAGRHEGHQKRRDPGKPDQGHVIPAPAKRAVATRHVEGIETEQQESDKAQHPHEEIAAEGAEIEMADRGV